MLKKIATRLMSNPTIYQMVQIVLGQLRTNYELKIVLGEKVTGRTLDVGSSGGSVSRRLAQDPIGIDIDVLPLVAMRRRARDARAVAASAGALPFPTQSFDLSLCIAVSHHLDDDTLRSALADIARVTRGRFVLLDPIRNDSRWIARLLWRYDRGSFPRTRAEILAELERFFTLERVVDFRYLHQYVLCVARAKRDSA